MRLGLLKALAIVGAFLGVAVAPGFAQVALISIGSDWKYLDDGSNQGTLWTGTGFSDVEWVSGAAELGYGDGDEVTTVLFGPDANNKYPTTYFRHSFNVLNAGSITNLRAQIKRDDGVIVYLNGTEVYRDNMAAGPALYSDFASATASDDGGSFTPFHLSPSLLISGNNVLAAEIHQSGTNSSDISFDFELIGNPLPLISITSPTEGQIIASTSVAVSGVAIPGGPTVTVVELFANGSKVGESADANFSIIWGGVVPGDYALTATVTDSSGLTATSAAVNISVVEPPTGTLISGGEVWKYQIGVGEASSPSTLWRMVGFDDASWSSGGTPIGYGEADVVTTIRASSTVPNYTSVYLRKTFNVPNPNLYGSLEGQVVVDDGAVVWVNGVEVGRINVPEGELLYSDAALVADERRTLDFEVLNAPSVLVAGQNVMAILAFNGNTTSSDLLVTGNLRGIADLEAPVVTDIDPPAGAIVLSLDFVNVGFSENVTGVDASDLLINGEPASAVMVISPREYSFSFNPAEEGMATVRFADDHGITDFSSFANPFAGAEWSYTVDPNASTTPILRITEFMTGNDNGIRDEDGDREDWIEILNLGPLEANLDGYYLTDDAANLMKWRMPAYTLAANNYLIVWASSKDRTNLTQLHTNFRLSSDGEFLALVDPSGMVVSAFSPTYPVQQDDVSYGRDIVNPNTVGYYNTPTPGAPNTVGGGGAGFAPDPVFSIQGGAYTNNTLSLVITAPSGTVRYTLNGTDPTEASNVSIGIPIPITASTMVKARTFAPGLLPSAIIVHTYNLLEGAGFAGGFTSKLPILIINTFGAAIPESVPPGGTRAKGSIVVIDTFRGAASILDTPQHQGPLQIEVRGQSSTQWAKDPHGFEIDDAYGNDISVGLVGLPAESDWVLNNVYTDKSFINDILAYDLHSEMGHYAPRSRLVEVFLDNNGGKVNHTGGNSGDYYGVMLLVEKIKIDNNRVDVERLGQGNNTEPDVTGGYIWKKDKDSTGDLNFNTVGGAGHSGIPLKYHDPKPREITTAQQQWLRNYMLAFEAALYATDWTTRLGTNHYSYYLDVNSAVDFHWIVEFSKQIDGYRISTYMHKDRGIGAKWNYDPIWDWNLSFGNADYLQGGTTNGWYYTQTSQIDHTWLRRLINGTASSAGTTGDPDFNQKITDRWGELRHGNFNKQMLLDRIDAFYELLKEAADREYTRWPRLNTYVWPNPTGGTAWHVNYATPGTYRDLMDQKKIYINGRWNWVDGQFPKAPTLNVTPGDVALGTLVSISTTEAGTLYYMLDGQDPRASGGNVRLGSQPYTGSIAVNDNIRITARTLNNNVWSPPVAGTYVVRNPSIIISEIMYHPAPDPDINSLYEPDDFQYIELKNTSGATVSLQGYEFTSGINFLFTVPAPSIPAGGTVVLVHNPAAFQSRYGVLPNVAGTYTNTLAHGGERIVLMGRVKELIHDFEYDDEWYPATDGIGFSLVVADEAQPRSMWSVKSGWRTGALGGTPGQSEGPAPSIPVVYVNEVLAHTDLPNIDFVELYNPNETDVDVGNWYITDDLRTPKFRIPSPTIIPAGGYVVFDEDDFNTVPNDPANFNFRSSGDEAYLLSGDSNGNLTGYVHGYEFGASLNGVSFGRYLNSVDREFFVAQSSVTKMAVNSGPKVGPVVISEIMYRPPDVLANGALWNNPEDEYVELVNLTGGTVPLYDPNATTNAWRLRDAVDYAFPLNTSLAANERILVVSFDPANTGMLNSFRLKFGVGQSIRVFGPYEGNLANSNEDVELIQADLVRFYETNEVITAVLVDKIDYFDDAPWPVAADGIGGSLQRINENAFGNDPMNWAAAAPTPGAIYGGGTPPMIASQPVDAQVVKGNSVSFAVAASGVGPFRYQWRFNGDNLYGETGPTLHLNNVQLSQQGQYQVVVLNAASAVSSDIANLTVLIAVEITTQPVGLERREGQSATFSVTATSSTPIAYQWMFNGDPIPGQTSATLTIPSVDREDDGIYSVLLTDAIGSISSVGVRLVVLIDPLPIDLNLLYTVVEGGSITMGIKVEGTLPMSYRWRRGFSTLKAETLNDYQSFFTTNNVPLTESNRTYSVVLTNQASYTPGVVTPNIRLFVLPDSNQNGLPDTWEAIHGVSDPNGHADTDGVSNGDEYISGTDPNDEESYLRIDGVSLSGGILIEFNAVAGLTYTIEYKDSLDDPTWNELTGVVASPNSGPVQVLDPEGNAQRFYRLGTPKVD